ncbi:RcnB family protein [Serratia proteamaculans]
MRKLKVVLCSALFSAAALSSVPAAWAEAEQSAEAAPEVQAPAVQTPESQNSLSQDPPATAPQTNPNDPYDLQYFFADFTRFAIGDVVPEVYRTKQYEIVQWKVRHLPAPEADSHWTYMGGNYVLITNAEGKILQAKQGEIYYKR